ncbi:hypothetical protein MTR67_012756 [Solanum verrucosum]|uniref:Integrase catalytic domain-containing protein n=1 Tax=Solanum verrucosum TaxID=315347 RepID=A0AAF0THB1_SOLVR|nr:hypothetical protein MTR67_012756 [Solanum verrucosum]
MHQGKVIAYASRQLKKHKQNYPTHDLELATVVFALKIWRQYLYGVHVDINMDFITGLPFSFKRHDFIWVIIDRLPKSANFLPDKSISTAEEYAKLYVREVILFHGTPLSIISYRGAQFTAHFWRSFQKSLGTQVNIRTAFHPQTDDQAERTIQTLKDMLRACVLDFKGETQILGPELVHQAVEKLKLIKERLKMAQSQQKSYTDVRRRDIEFQVAYEVDFPRELAAVHPVFQVSMLHKCLGDPTQVIPIEGMGFSEHLSYEKVPMAILDRQVRKLRRKDVASVKAVKFKWSDACEKSFQELKDRLTKVPVLALLEGTKGYAVYCDASGIGLGCVLMHQGKVIAYASRQLKKHKQNYPTHDLELATVVFALKIWRQYLYGVHVDSFTDHKSLQYVFKKRDLNIRQRRWLELLKDYDVNILYHPEDDTFICQGRRCVPNIYGLMQKLLDEAHCSRYLIHSSSTKMYHDLKEVYWWNDMKRNIAEYVEQFSNSQQVKAEHQRPGGLAQTMDIPIWK